MDETELFENPKFISTFNSTLFGRLEVRILPYWHVLCVVSAHCVSATPLVEKSRRLRRTTLNKSFCCATCHGCGRIIRSVQYNMVSEVGSWDNWCSTFLTAAMDSEHRDPRVSSAERAAVNMGTLSPPPRFDFANHGMWPKWILGFEDYSFASGL